MKIKKIHIDGFGKLHDFDIELGDGINVFCGQNEAGKSTLHMFIRSVLYGASNKRRLGARSIYERMRPWKNPEVYRGRMEIEFERQRYMIERDFNKAPDDLVIMELAKGVSGPVKEPEELIKRMLNGLSETAYVNTVSAGQLSAATGKDMANELRKYSSNVSTTMNPKLSADKALEYLAKEKEALNAKLDTEAAKEYNKVLTEIKRIEAELELPENENRISEFSETADKLSREGEAISDSIDNAESEIVSHSEALKEKGFADEAEIYGISKRVHEDYESLKALKIKAYNGLSFAIAVILFIAAGGAAFYGYRYADEAMRLPAYVGGAAAAVIALGLSIRIASLRRRYRTENELLAEEIKPYIGEQSPDDESMKAFDEYIGTAGAISGQINDIRAKREILGTEQRKLNDDYAICLDKLTEQQRKKNGVEELLARLNLLKSREVELARVISDNKLVREKLEALQLAEETLTELASDIKNAVGTFINKEASEMVSAITDNSYDSISAGQSFDIELNSKQGMISVSDMSAGTTDQVYLAIRLATIRFITGEDDPMPLMLDDSFNLYDDKRLEASLRFLAASYKGQILIFTCQDREELLMDKLGIAYKRIKM